MLNVNNDMDDLLRRAAENYPLKTDGANFDKVLEGLQLVQEVEDTPVKKRRGRFLWLLLLLPLSFVCNRYIYPGTEKRAATETIGKTQENAPPISPSIAQHDSKQPIQNANLQLKKSPAAKALAGAKTLEFDPTDEDVPADNNTASVTDAQRAISPPPITSFNFKEKKSSLYEEPFKPGNKNEVPIYSPEVNSNLKVPVNAPENKKSGSNKEIDESIAFSPELDKNEMPLDSKDEKANPQKTIVQNPSVSDTAVPNILTAAKEKSRVRTKRLYAGVIAGPDLSTIKSRSVSKVGLSAGILVGYQLNKKLSIESGVLWDKKFYNGDGKYFDTKKTSIPSYVKILELEGYCNMFELPIGLKYDFTRNKRSGWFAVMGASSYFMKKESYHYSYLSYGVPSYRTASYNNSSTNWLSILNISVGYTHSVGKSGLLRIEPYLKIPVKGVGIGSLPISSSGLYAGFIKKLF